MAAGSTGSVESRRDGGVLNLTLNRPQVLNSLTAELLDSLVMAFEAARSDPEVRAIVITGAGRAFCAGQDLTRVLEADVDVCRELHEHYLPLIGVMRGIEKPIIAAINGVTAGAGLSLALAADLRVAAETATLVVAFARVGLVPDAGASYFLPRVVGLGKASELALLGDPLDATEAHRIGLVNCVVPPARLEATTSQLAARLARGPRSLGLTKRLLNTSLDSSLSRQLQCEEEAQVEAAATADFAEGVRAFLEKRPARFSGR